MARAFKNNAIGIDKGLNDVNKYLYESLTQKANWTNYQAYHRAYKLQTNKGVVPEIYTQHSGDTGDYLDVLMDDNYTATSFYTIADITDLNEIISYDVSLFMQLNLRKLYPNIAHRADEVAHNDVITALKNDARVILTSITTRIENVYSEFRTDNLIYDDMSQLHVFRIDFTLDADYCCSFNEENPDFTTGGGFNYIN